MAIKSHAVVSVATTATELYDPQVGTSGTPESVVFYNGGAQNIFLGDSLVTTSIGIPITPGEKFSMSMMADSGGKVYGIVASGTADMRILAVGV